MNGKVHSVHCTGLVFSQTSNNYHNHPVIERQLSQIAASNSSMKFDFFILKLDDSDLFFILWHR